MKNIRVRKENAGRFCSALRDAGFHARITRNVRFLDQSLPYYGMAGDQAHESFYSPVNWVGIETNASGNKAHVVFAALED